MSVDPFYYPPTVGAGYTCGVCQTFVPYNTVHHCPGYSGSPQTVKWDRMTDVRIADALERIADALEAGALTRARFLRHEAAAKCRRADSTTSGGAA